MSPLAFVWDPYVMLTNATYDFDPWSLETPVQVPDELEWNWILPKINMSMKNYFFRV